METAGPTARRPVGGVTWLAASPSMTTTAARADPDRPASRSGPGLQAPARDRCSGRERRWRSSALIEQDRGASQFSRPGFGQLCLDQLRLGWLSAARAARAAARSTWSSAAAGPTLSTRPAITTRSATSMAIMVVIPEQVEQALVPGQVVRQQAAEPLVLAARLHQGGDRLAGHVGHRPALHLGDRRQPLGQRGIEAQHHVLGPGAPGIRRLGHLRRHLSTGVGLHGAAAVQATGRRLTPRWKLERR